MSDTIENDAPVQGVPCFVCKAEPGQPCGDEGPGWHLMRWDFLEATRVLPPGSGDTDADS